MRPVYAVRLAVFPGGQVDPDSHHDALVAMAHRWLVQRAERSGRQDLDPDSSCSIRFPGPPHGIHGETQHSRQDAERAWRGVIVHPYESDRTRGQPLRVRSEIQIFTDGAESNVTMRVLMGSIDEAIVPEWFEIRTPRLVRDLISTGRVLAGNIDVRSGPWIVGPEKADQLVAYIAQANRQIPIVVISRTEDNRILVNAGAIAREVNGVGQTVVLQDFNTAFRLTSALGREHTAYNGAVRIYWPGFSVGDSRYYHKLYTVEEIARDGLSGRMEMELLHRFSSIAAWRIASDSRVWVLERAETRRIEDERDNAIRVLMAQVAAASDLPGERDERTDELLADLQHQIETAQRVRKEAELKAADDRQRLIQDAESKQRGISDVLEGLLEVAETEREEYRQKYLQPDARLQAMQAAGSAQDELRSHLDMIKRSMSVSSLVEALELICQISSEDYVTILPDAFNSAREWRFTGSMQGAMKLFRSICLVAERYHRRELDGVTNFRDAFAQEDEPGYIHDSSVTTLAKYRSKYERFYDDGRGLRSILLRPHLTFGSGNGYNSLKVYWHVDEEHRRFVIGHIGSHLPIASR
jgi:hypothetical protein